MKTFRKILFLLSSREKKQVFLLVLMILVMAILDTIGVASILPFMAILTNPSLIETNGFLNSLFKFSMSFGVENNQQFLFFLGLLVLILLIASLSFKALTTYVQLRFVHMRDYSICKRLVEGYLRQPFTWFLNRNSAELGKTILSEVGQVINTCIKPLIELIAKGMVAIAIIILLIVTDPKLALTVGFLLGGFYGAIYYFARNFLNQIGKERLYNNNLRFKTLSEAFGAIKEVKVGGLEQKYTKQFSNAAKPFARTQALAQIIGQLPRYILEAIGFGGIMLIILYLIKQKGNFNSALPIISMYVFAGYRLMPAVQQIYASFTNITFVNSALDKLYDDFSTLKELNINQDNGFFSINKSINLNDIHFNYPNTSRTALKGINLSIPAKKIVGFIGATGSGKTTTVDIILGLLEPQKGTLEIDENIITKQNLRAWQRCVGYVPQNIYLSDDTVEANIAFGEEVNNINTEAVKNASKIANLHMFVTEELSLKYQTKIGERGVRLSGGQRQRIGIARALYHKPQVLIFDEATNALDNQTEIEVMDAINNLSKNITIILIAHRLKTLKNCDIIFKFKNGKIIDKGSFKEIITDS